MHLFILLLIVAILANALSSLTDHGENTKSDNFDRNLLASKRVKRKGARGGRRSKSSKLTTLVNSLTIEAAPQTFQPATWSKPHRPNVPFVILSAAMSVDTMPRDVINFAGTARKAGFDGDIVLAMVPGTRKLVIDRFIEYETVVYNVSVSCKGSGHNQ
eukprot:gene17932-36618_t